MKKKAILILSILIVLIIGTALGIRTLNLSEKDNSIELNMYFPKSNASSLISEKRVVEYNKEESVIKEILRDFIKGPIDTKNASGIDKETKIISIKQEPNGTLVDFSKEFLTDDDAKNIFSVFAVVKTLSQIPGISRVKVLVESKEISGPDKKTIGFLSGESINLENEKDVAQTRYVTLYFADKETNELTKEQRLIKITDAQPIEKHILAELIKGPENEKLKAVLAPETMVISIETTEGTCFVNFGANFTLKNSGTSEKEILAIYSIVNSLTELETVNNVQILVDGKKVSELGKTPIEDTLYKNTIIEK